MDLSHSPKQKNFFKTLMKNLKAEANAFDKIISQS